VARRRTVAHKGVKAGKAIAMIKEPGLKKIVASFPSRARHQSYLLTDELNSVCCCRRCLWGGAIGANWRKDTASRHYLTSCPVRGTIRQLKWEEDAMGTLAQLFVRLLAIVLIFGIAVADEVTTSARQEAISATVMGEMVQKVGYRAMIQKQAIMYNLAGYARNDPDGTVGVRLQGDKQRIDMTLEAISAGTMTSSKANVIGKTQAALDPNLKTFTVFGWTSRSRGISHPYEKSMRARSVNDPDFISVAVRLAM
jgi:acylphosphatase